MTSWNYTLKGSIAAFLFLLISSCAKNTDSYATFICRDNADLPVSNVKVELYNYIKTDTGSVYPALPTTEGFTDENGKLSFLVKHAAMYRYKVTSDSANFTGLMKLQQGKETDKYFIIP
jgi:hypothetical protein